VGTQEQRSAENQAIFRAGNEALRRSADGRAPALRFLCECGDETCFERATLELADYESIRKHPRRFIVVSGHEDNSGDSSRVVERLDSYSVIEKLDGAGEIAERRDPRSKEAR
jgi:hypothetical protein